MKVVYDLPPDVVSLVEGRANGAEVPVDEFVADRLRSLVAYPTVRARIQTAVGDGMCDADIAALMHYAPGRIAEIRRSLGLPPNKRYRRGG